MRINNSMMTVKPYTASGSKKKQVKQMFDRISGEYDKLNHLLSAGIDIRWRKKTLAELGNVQPDAILDVATGTGDFALMLHDHWPEAMVTGLDLSPGMLEVAGKKVAKAGLENSIDLVEGDSENLPFEDNFFDLVTVGFGVRNFEHLSKGISEMQRVLKPGGKLAILEFTKPRTPVVKQLFQWYFKHLLPRIGGAISGDTAAYRYLFDSVQAFPEYEALTDIMTGAGFSKTYYKPLTFGICCIYIGEK